MATYKVSTYNDKTTFTVVLDESGVIGSDDLPADMLENLKMTVERRMSRNGLPAPTALALAVGSYSYVEETDSVADPA